jgi:hypothetical protein
MPISRAYGNSATGFDYGAVRQAAKDDRDFKRKELKSFYDITADLDAAAASSMRAMIDEISNKIDSNELRIGTGDWERNMSRLRSLAGGLKETQDLQKKVMKSFVDNPNSFLYVGGQKGFELDEGFEGFMREASRLSSMEFSTPEEYIQNSANFLSKVQPTVDMKSALAGMSKIIEEELQAAENATLINAKGYKDVVIGNKTFRQVPVNIASAIERSKQRIKAMYPQAIEQMAIRGRTFGVLPQESENISAAEQLIADMIPEERMKQFEATNPTIRTLRAEKAPRAEGKPSITPEEQSFADKVAAAALKSTKEFDVSPIQEFVSPFGVDVKIKGDKFVFTKRAESAAGKKYDKEVRSVVVGDMDGLYQALSEINSNVKFQAIQKSPSYNAEIDTEEIKQRGQRAKVEQEINNIKGILARAVTSPTVISVATQNDDIPKSNKQFLEAYISSFADKGVKLEKSYFGTITGVTIDGTTYDIKKDQDKIAELLEKKARRVSIETKSEQPVKLTPSEKSKGL